MKVKAILRTSSALELSFDDGTIINFGKSGKYGNLFYISSLLSYGPIHHDIFFQCNRDEEVDSWWNHWLAKREAMEISKSVTHPTGDLAKPKRL